MKLWSQHNALGWGGSGWYGCLLGCGLRRSLVGFGQRRSVTLYCLAEAFQVTPIQSLSQRLRGLIVHVRWQVVTEVNKTRLWEGRYAFGEKEIFLRRTAWDTVASFQHGEEATAAGSEGDLARNVGDAAKVGGGKAAHSQGSVYVRIETCR